MRALFHLIFTFVSFGACTELVFRLQDPPGSATQISVASDTQVILRCIGTPNGQPLQWLFKGADINHSIIKTDGLDSLVVIESFNGKTHEGLYECYTKTASSSYRLKAEFEAVTPEPGSRLCIGKENRMCDHAKACLVEIYNEHIYCKCENGWQGPRCEMAIEPKRSNSQPSECPTWPVVSLAGVILLFGTCATVFGIYWCVKKQPARRSRTGAARTAQGYASVDSDAPNRINIVKP